MNNAKKWKEWEKLWKSNGAYLGDKRAEIQKDEQAKAAWFARQDAKIAEYETKEQDKEALVEIENETLVHEFAQALDNCSVFDITGV